MNNFFLSIYLLSILCINVFHGRIVKTTSGLVKATNLKVLNKAIEQYTDIPYAEPPIGKLRFGKPIPLQRPVNVILDDLQPKRSCVQPVNSLLKIPEHYNEDCLTINIWSPEYKEGMKLKTVMFWIHGGAFTGGSIHDLMHSGGILATYDVVLIMPNYRVGWFGFLYGDDESAPGNVGLFDQVLALRWVRDNIHLFGGDKNQITIFGVSAGSMSVSAHIISPISKGLFRRAILMEGAHFYYKNNPVINKEDALNKAKELARKNHCKDDQWLACLRKLDAKDILATVMMLPLDDTEFLPMTARRAFEEGKFNRDIDLLAGFAKDEGTITTFIFNPSYSLKNNFTLEDCKAIIKNSLDTYNFPVGELDKFINFYLGHVDKNNSTALRWKVYEFSGQLMIICPTYYFAKLYAQHSANNSNVYVYELTDTAFEKKMWLYNGPGVPHGSNWELAFGHPIVFSKSNPNGNVEFSLEYMKLITDFAKTGKPDPNWPKLVRNSALSQMEFIKDMNPHDKNKYHHDYFKDTCNGIWKGYF